MLQLKHDRPLAMRTRRGLSVFVPVVRFLPVAVDPMLTSVDVSAAVRVDCAECGPSDGMGTMVDYF